MTNKKAYSFESIESLLEIQSKKNSNRIALENPKGQRVSYQNLNFITNFLAEEIKKSIPNCPNPRVAIVCGNGLEMALTLLSVTRMGIAMPLNPNYHKNELHYYLQDLEPDLIIIEDKLIANFQDVTSKLKIKTITLDNFFKILLKDELKVAAKKTERQYQINSNAIAIILMTSGSTGRSKKVPLSHKNICTSVREVCETLELNQDDICLCMWEQFHIGGLTDLLLAPLASGGKILCTEGFKTDDFYKFLKKFQPTWFQGVPTSFIEILRVGRKSQFNFRLNSLRFIRAVASALPQDIQKELEDNFGKPVIQTFGMTEAGPLITTNLLPPKKRKIGSVGKSSGSEVAIMSEDGKILSFGEIGEVVIKGENVFEGYENNEKENEYAFRYEWFHTGDLGFLDEEAYLFLTGRIKEQINRGGEKISPQEIDDIFLQHNSILNAACFAIPHPTLGEEIGAAVVLKDKNTSISELEDFLSERLSKFKIPKKIIVLDRLPINAIGKIERNTLSGLSSQKEIPNKENFHLTNLEKLLTLIWETELEVEGVKIHDDFVSLGGDSLSSLRLISSIEKILNINLDLNDLLNFKNISLMAQYLKSEINISEIYIEDILSRINKENIRKVLYSTTIYDSEKLNNNIFINFNFNDYRLIIESRLNIATPIEVKNLIEESKIEIEKNIKTIDKNEFIAFTNWTNKAKRLIVLDEFNKNWKIEKINENIFLYKNSKNENRQIIVAFCGNMMRLMMPTYIFLGFIEKNECDVLLMRDPTMMHYVNGIEGISTNIDSLEDWIQSFMKKNGYRKKLFFGTSAGGLVSLALGLKTNNNAIAICPESPHTQLTFKDYLTKKNSNINKNISLKVFSGKGYERDVKAAKEIEAILPQAQIIIDHECNVHYYLFDLFLRHKFKSFILNQLCF